MRAWATAPAHIEQGSKVTHKSQSISRSVPSVAAASRMLSIAQSALTKSLLELESELGSELFERSSRGMALTAQGHRFLASARKVIGSVADAMRLHAGEADIGRVADATVGTDDQRARRLLHEVDGQRIAVAIVVVI